MSTTVLLEAMQYVIKPGDSLWDAVLNSTGTIAGLDAVLTENGMTDWTPPVYPGQVIQIPAGVTIDPNALQQLQQFPVCNNLTASVLGIIAEIWSILTNNWILLTGFWADTGIWIDSDSWID